MEVLKMAALKTEVLKTKGTDWLDQAVQRAKGKYQIQRVLEERSVQEEVLKRKLGNQFCRELFTWFESIEVRFNSRFGGHVLAVSVVGSDGSRSVQILARPIRDQESTASLSYDENTTSLELRAGSEAAQTIKLVLSGDGAILAEIGAERYTPEQLGQRIIDDLLA
jgi:hypothetical protein